jgi:peptidoglycan/xylan/chitin deacetylase (PgdA/CDA1 family)
MMLPATTPAIIEYLFSGRRWRMPSVDKSLYLTFDDGPDPRITNNVLDLLAQYNARATFFCIGHRVEAYRDTYERILLEGHAVGNHTHRHINGWKTDTDQYLADVHQAAGFIDSTLFRPPYGRVSAKQLKQIGIMGFTTVMWTVLSGDYEKTLSKEACAKRTLSTIESGAIYLFHDSEKAEQNMMYALEALLKAGSEQNYSFKKIELKSLV